MTLNKKKILVGFTTFYMEHGRRGTIDINDIHNKGAIIDQTKR